MEHELTPFEHKKISKIIDETVQQASETGNLDILNSQENELAARGIEHPANMIKDRADHIEALRARMVEISSELEKIDAFLKDYSPSADIAGFQALMEQRERLEKQIQEAKEASGNGAPAELEVALAEVIKNIEGAYGEISADEEDEYEKRKQVLTEEYAALSQEVEDYDEALPLESKQAIYN